MNNPIFANEEIKRFIPQREPIFMVDKLFEVDNVHAVTGLTVSPGNMFLQDGHFIESGLIEHSAQSASVLVGYEAYKENKPAPVGYIGEVRKARFFRFPVVDDELVTTIEIVSEVDGLSLVKAAVRVDDEVVFECQMKIFVKQES
ncbi:MAG: hydroxymyristoyl-ACP dehydratase [Candidatus Aphodosoma sp.]